MSIDGFKVNGTVHKYNYHALDNISVQLDDVDDSVFKYSLFTGESSDENGFIIPKDIVYTSSTNNVLDVDNVIHGITVGEPSDGTFMFHKNAVMSRLIPLKGAESITISGYTLPEGMHICIALLKNPKLVISGGSNDIWRITGTSRTISIPSNDYVFAVVGLRPASDVAAYSNFDYSGMKLSLSGTATNDSFEGVFYGYASQYKNFGKELTFDGISESQIIKTSLSRNILDTSDVIHNYRGTDNFPYFVNRSGCVMSKPIFVRDYDYITIRSSSVSPNIRWIIFTSKPEMNSEYVVGVSNGFMASSGVESVDYTIDIPYDAIWAYVTLKSVDGGDTWTNDTIAYGLEATSDSYIDGGFLGILDNSDNPCTIVKKDTDTLYSEVSRNEWFRTISDFIPLTIGTSSDSVSFSGQYNRCNLIFFTDSHIDYINPSESLQNVVDIVNYANDAKFHLDAIINAGDAITPFGESKTTATGRFEKFANVLKSSTKPVIYAKGNHDLNDWNNQPEKTLTDSDWSSLWYDYAESEYGIVRQTKSSGDKSTWHYYDIDDHKIRIVAVDVQDTDKTTTDSNGKVKYSGANSFYISNEQMNWIVNTALNFDNKEHTDWGVIFVLHQYVDKNGVAYSTTNSPAYESAITKLDLICKAFNEQSTYTNSYTFSEDSFYNLSINANFTRYANSSEKPYMICWLLGHEHFDRYQVINGFPKIWTANSSATSEYSDNRVARVNGTSTQNCFDLISIDTNTRKIRIVRYGAGKNCFGTGGNRFLPEGLGY